jgi:protein-tyrosine phosphatase
MSGFYNNDTCAKLSTNIVSNEDIITQRSIVAPKSDEDSNTTENVKESYQKIDSVQIVNKIETDSLNESILIDQKIQTDIESYSISNSELKTIIVDTEKLNKSDCGILDEINTTQKLESIQNIIKEPSSDPWMDPFVNAGDSKKNRSHYCTEYQIKGADEANWAIPGVLAFGSCPYNDTVPESINFDIFEPEIFDPVNPGSLITILLSLFKNGIRHIICLQKEYPTREEYQQKKINYEKINKMKYRGLPPYFELVHHIYEKRVEYGLGHDWTRPQFTLIPIIDCGVTDDEKMNEYTNLCVDGLLNGVCYYVHCWGGHGRAGAFVSIIMRKLFHWDYERISKYMQAVHDCRILYVKCSCPQTEIQKKQVKRFCDNLIKKI